MQLEETTFKNKSQTISYEILIESMHNIAHFE